MSLAWTVEGATERLAPFDQAVARALRGESPDGRAQTLPPRGKFSNQTKAQIEDRKERILLMIAEQTRTHQQIRAALQITDEKTVGVLIEALRRDGKIAPINGARPFVYGLVSKPRKRGRR